jgi:hypothetical protein
MREIRVTSINVAGVLLMNGSSARIVWSLRRRTC